MKVIFFKNKVKKISKLFLLFFFVIFQFQTAFADDFKLALWVESEGTVAVLDTPLDSTKLIDFLSLYHFDEIYLQVYRNGKSWFKTDYADNSPYLKISKNNFDPISYIIGECHKRNIKVYAWMNILRVINNKSAPIITKLKNDSVHIDSLGNSLLNYKNYQDPYPKKSSYKLGTPGIWLDPADVKTRQFLLNLINDFIKRYPEIDGVHFDMFRQPIAVPKQMKKNVFKSSLSFSGSSLNKILFDKYKELNPSATREDWKRSRITRLAKEVKSLITKYYKKPLSAAVIPSIDTAINYTYQDWPSWIREGVMDEVSLMNYTDNFKVFKKTVDEASKLPGADKIVIGLGAWKMKKDINKLIQFVDYVRMKGFRGVALFSYSNLNNKDGKKLLDRSLKAYFNRGNQVFSKPKI